MISQKLVTLPNGRTSSSEYKGAQMIVITFTATEGKVASK